MLSVALTQIEPILEITNAFTFLMIGPISFSIISLHLYPSNTDIVDSYTNWLPNFVLTALLLPHNNNTRNSLSKIILPVVPSDIPD